MKFFEILDIEPLIMHSLFQVIAYFIWLLIIRNTADLEPM